jgi:putative endonuclease
MTKQEHVKIGRLGEDLAVEFLQDNSYKILERNYHSSRGEIDIIALDKEEVVFLEVKTRAKDIEAAQASMTYTKCQKIIKTAEYFLFKNPEYEDFFTRFDLLVVIIRNKEPEVHHIKEAISF